MGYKGTERRHSNANDVEGIAQRVVREGVSIDQITLRESDKAREAELRNAVRNRLLTLAGSVIEKASHVVGVAKTEASKVAHPVMRPVITVPELNHAMKSASKPPESSPTRGTIRTPGTLDEIPVKAVSESSPAGKAAPIVSRPVLVIEEADPPSGVSWETSTYHSIRPRRSTLAYCEDFGSPAGVESGTPLTKEQSELRENLSKQYPDMVSVLEKYEIDTNGMPIWEQIEKSLDPGTLNALLRIPEPSLLLVSPCARDSKILAIDNHPAEIQKFSCACIKFKENELWNSLPSNKWRVIVGEGIQNIAQDRDAYDGKKNNVQMTEFCIKKILASGLDVFNDADSYLTLVMTMLAKNKPIDTNAFTVLNGKSLSMDLVFGRWLGEQVYMGLEPADRRSSLLRLRRCKEIPLLEAA